MLNFGDQMGTGVSMVASRRSRGAHHAGCRRFAFGVNFELYRAGKVKPLFLLLLVRQQEKSQKYFDLLAFSNKLNHSSMRITVDAMNFQQWELVLAHQI